MYVWMKIMNKKVFLHGYYNFKNVGNIYVLGMTELMIY